MRLSSYFNISLYFFVNPENKNHKNMNVPEKIISLLNSCHCLIVCRVASLVLPELPHSHPLVL